MKAGLWKGKRTVYDKNVIYNEVIDSDEEVIDEDFGSAWFGDGEELLRAFICRCGHHLGYWHKDLEY